MSDCLKAVWQKVCVIPVPELRGNSVPYHGACTLIKKTINDMPQSVEGLRCL
jgi:hypothetical protein